MYDTLLPPDAYAQPPPVYPLFNWTLPYGPDRDLLTPTPSPSHSPATPGPGGGRIGLSMTGRVSNDIRVHFKGPSEIRQVCVQPEQQVG